MDRSPTASIARRIAQLGIVFALWGGVSAIAAAERCDSDVWAFFGAVRDSAGQPIGDAEVFLLLDKINHADYLKEGVRGRRFHTNEYGKFQAGLICSDSSDRPNPCSRKLRHLTVAASSRGHMMKLQVFKLATLEVVDEDGVCFIHLPEIRLGREH